MTNQTIKARHAMGNRVVGQALVAHDGFSARYDLNRLQGVFSRPAHKLVVQSYVNKILVLDTAKGGSRDSMNVARDEVAQHGPVGHRVQYRKHHPCQRSRTW